MIAVLYYATPNVQLRGFKWVTPGRLVALLVWLVASALFAFYVANFGTYNKTYGALAGVIVFLSGSGSPTSRCSSASSSTPSGAQRSSRRASRGPRRRSSSTRATSPRRRRRRSRRYNTSRAPAHRSTRLGLPCRG